MLGNILEHLPKTDKYIEVFGGSGAVLTNRPRSKFEVFNDLNSGVTSFYKCISDSKLVLELIAVLENTIWSSEYFEWCRDTWQDCNTTVDRAARWYYMISMSFGSLGRNFGRTNDGAVNLADIMRRKLWRFQDLHIRWRNVFIDQKDWRQIIDTFQADDAVFYLDPPYTNTDAGTYKDAAGWGDAQHQELLEVVFGSPGFYAVSARPSALYDAQPWTEIYKWDQYSTINALGHNSNNNRQAQNSTRSHEPEYLYIKKA